MKVNRKELLKCLKLCRKAFSGHKAAVKLSCDLNVLRAVSASEGTTVYTAVSAEETDIGDTAMNIIVSLDVLIAALSASENESTELSLSDDENSLFVRSGDIRLALSEKREAMPIRLVSADSLEKHIHVSDFQEQIGAVIHVCSKNPSDDPRLRSVCLRSDRKNLQAIAMTQFRYAVRGELSLPETDRAVAYASDLEMLARTAGNEFDISMPGDESFLYVSSGKAAAAVSCLSGGYYDTDHIRSRLREEQPAVRCRIEKAQFVNLMKLGQTVSSNAIMTLSGSQIAVSCESEAGKMERIYPCLGFQSPREVTLKARIRFIADALEALPGKTAVISAFGANGPVRITSEESSQAEEVFMPMSTAL